jgi:hypothetical protein
MGEMGSKTHIGLHVLLLLSILMKLSLQIFKNTQILSLMKIRPMVAELFPVEKQTGMTKLIVAFRSFGKAPRNEASSVYSSIWGLKKPL